MATKSLVSAAATLGIERRRTRKRSPRNPRLSPPLPATRPTAAPTTPSSSIREARGSAPRAWSEEEWLAERRRQARACSRRQEGANGRAVGEGKGEEGGGKEKALLDNEVSTQQESAKRDQQRPFQEGYSLPS